MSFFNDLIKCKVYVGEDYRIIKKEDKLYIEAYNDDGTSLYKRIGKSNIVTMDEVKKENNRYYEDKILDETILKSIIDLKKKIPKSNLYNEPNLVSERIQKEIEQEVEKTDSILFILEWCKKYGMPFLGDFDFKIGEIAESEFQYFRIQK